jgi:hypothetical protein
MSSSEYASSNASEDSQPTPQEQGQSETVVTNWLSRLNLDGTMAPASVAGSATAPTNNNANNGLRVGSPREFTGTGIQVKPFILQCRLVFAIDIEKFNTAHKKMMYVISYMKGPAFEFIQPHLEDYLDNLGDATARKDTTRRILRSENTLFEEIRSTFGQINEQQEAERALFRVRQQGPATKYKADFHTLAARVDWNDQAFAAQFYQGLKDSVKDEIARGERPTSLKEMEDLAIKIDTRIWERQQEKSGKFVPRVANTQAKRDKPQWRHNYYGPQPMELDATRGKPGQKGPRGKGKPQGKSQKERKPFDKSNSACHNCGTKGHFAKECTARKQRHELQKPEHAKAAKTETVAATRPMDHAMMTWTMCTDDYCHIHLSDKEGSGWFPRGKAQSVCALRIAQPQEPPRVGILPDVEDEYEVVETTEETSDESSDDISIYTTERWAMPENDIGMSILAMLRDQWERVAPWDQGIQYVNPVLFDELLEAIRRKMRTIPIHGGSDAPISYRRIVREIVPFGSEFTPRGGYFTPEGINIPRSLRQEIAALQNRFHEEAERQRQRERIIPITPRLIGDSPTNLQEEWSQRFGETRGSNRSNTSFTSRSELEQELTRFAQRQHRSGNERSRRN